MSKIDDTQQAISAASDQLGQAISAANSAAQEAGEAQAVLADAGAEGNAAVLGQVRDLLETAVQQMSAATETLNEAHAQAETGKG